jgi:DNA-binding response OmpR family regulator
VTKPFSPRELVLRVESVLRRVRAGSVGAAGSTADAGPEPADASRGSAPRELRDGSLVLDLVAHHAALGTVPLALTGREFDLLAFLLANPGQAFTREQLMERVWGWEFGDQSTVTVHVRRLREKVETDPSNPVRLATVWGIGYRWDAGA